MKLVNKNICVKSLCALALVFGFGQVALSAAAEQEHGANVQKLADQAPVSERDQGEAALAFSDASDTYEEANRILREAHKNCTRHADKATAIQAVWRGYATRKKVRLAEQGDAEKARLEQDRLREALLAEQGDAEKARLERLARRNSSRKKAFDILMVAVVAGVTYSVISYKWDTVKQLPGVVRDAAKHLYNSAPSKKAVVSSVKTGWNAVSGRVRNFFSRS